MRAASSNRSMNDEVAKLGLSPRVELGQTWGQVFAMTHRERIEGDFMALLPRI